MTVREALAASIDEDRIIHLHGGADEASQLVAVATGHVDTGHVDTGDGVTEYWGTTLADNTWRVHLHRVVTT